MIFSTYWFLIFFGLVLIFFHGLRSHLHRSLLLAFANVVFYLHFSGPAGIIPILTLGAITYIFTLSKNALILNSGVVICVVSLVFYKYISFISKNIVLLFPSLEKFPTSEYAPLIAPLALSFFVFEFIHYIYDVKKGAKRIQSPLEFVHFAMFFPTLVAGPIKRFEQFIPSLNQALRSKISAVDLNYGLIRICIGFSKKLIADNLTVYIGYVDTRFMEYPVGMRWFFFGAIAMRIYLDFSGYSDMAIGAGRMIGIKVPENFNFPYLATNLSNFWRRWHISLSSWIRDYLYIPMGGDRVGSTRHSFNLLTVFLLCGLWHGAEWNFVFWGLFHGAGLIFETYLFVLCGIIARRFPAMSAKKCHWFKVMRNKFSSIIGWFFTTFFVWAGWLLFFYPPTKAIDIFLSLFNITV